MFLPICGWTYEEIKKKEKKLGTFEKFYFYLTPETDLGEQRAVGRSEGREVRR